MRFPDSASAEQVEPNSARLPCRSRRAHTRIAQSRTLRNRCVREDRPRLSRPHPLPSDAISDLLNTPQTPSPRQLSISAAPKRQHAPLRPLTTSDSRCRTAQISILARFQALRCVPEPITRHDPKLGIPKAAHEPREHGGNRHGSSTSTMLRASPPDLSSLIDKESAQGRRILGAVEEEFGKVVPSMRATAAIVRRNGSTSPRISAPAPDLEHPADSTQPTADIPCSDAANPSLA